MGNKKQKPPKRFETSKKFKKQICFEEIFLWADLLQKRRSSCPLNFKIREIFTSNSYFITSRGHDI